MTRRAPRSIDEYLRQLREELAGQDPALIQDALYDAEEYLRAEVAANPGRVESDTLELIASTYGAPDEVAAAYRDTERKLKATLAPPPRRFDGALGRFFGVFLDARAYSSVMLMLLSLATGIIYFVVAVTGLSLSAGLAVLIIGIPFFLLFILICRVIALAEGRLIEALTGVRMPRRPVHPPAAHGVLPRIGAMLKDGRTWSTLGYMILMLPLGIVYFTLAVLGLVLSCAFIVAPVFDVGLHYDWFPSLSGHVRMNPAWLWDSLWTVPLVMCLGVLLLTAFLHLAKGVGKLHASFAKTLLVRAAAGTAADAPQRAGPGIGATDPPSA
jgi:uncharacterized membrane protein